MTRVRERLAGAGLAWFHVRTPDLCACLSGKADRALKRILFADPPVNSQTIAPQLESAIGIALILTGVLFKLKERSFPG